MRNGSPNFLSLSLLYFPFLSLPSCPLIKLFFISREFADIFAFPVRLPFHPLSLSLALTKHLNPLILILSLSLTFLSAYFGRVYFWMWRSIASGSWTFLFEILFVSWPRLRRNLGKREKESAICSGREWIPTTRCQCYGMSGWKNYVISYVKLFFTKELNIKGKNRVLIYIIIIL